MPPCCVAPRKAAATALPVLSECLTGEEMSHITNILQQPESAAWREQALQDYISIVQSEAAKRSRAAAEDPLTAAIEKNKEKKQYGGKRNG